MRRRAVAREGEATHETNVEVEERFVDPRQNDSVDCHVAFLAPAGGIQQQELGQDEAANVICAKVRTLQTGATTKGREWQHTDVGLDFFHGLL